jgi:parallel beta-helix repeat protein
VGPSPRLFCGREALQRFHTITLSNAFRLVALLLACAPHPSAATTYYVRQTSGDDTRDGTSPATAWRHVDKLSRAMHAGDTAYVGPGLYREEIVVENDGASDARIVFVADITGQHTGDPPGVVMLAGADPVDETIFKPAGSPGLYATPIPERVWGAVEMDGLQFRYGGTQETKEHAIDKLSEREVVAKLPSTYYYDEGEKVLYLHTSDGRPPSTHEIELIRRGSGVLVVGRHYVTVMGFTFRHMQDGGINFFKGSGDEAAIGNTAYGCRQGIRVYDARNTLIYGNTLFRNENSGVYFAAKSSGAAAIGNVTYENVKGLRWSSGSRDALVVDNVAFDNRERGIAIEETDGVQLRRNRLANNTVSQLLVIRSTYGSESNCFGAHGADELVADFFPFREGDRYRTLDEYQKAKAQDVHSQAGNCGPLPEKVDVHKLHADTLGYAERARSAGQAAPEAPRGWLDWLFRR